MTQIKVRNFTMDRGLGYLIQSTTKDSTQEILGYFYSIASFVIDNLSKKSSARWLDKFIVLFYKDTAISYRIRIQGPGPGDTQRESIFSIDISYPKDSDTFDVTELMNAIVESGLGLSNEQNLPAFGRPQLKSPACLRTVRMAQDEQRDKTNT